MLTHRDNITGKISKNYKSQKSFFENFYRKYYLPWNRSNSAIRGISKNNISQRVSLVEKYYKKIDRANNQDRPRGKSKYWIKSQSKFRSTVIEEFCYYLLKDIYQIKALDLEFKKGGVHSGFEVDFKGKIKPKKKNVDCCIVKAEKGNIGNKKFKLLIPIIAIECKTYLDGTMWNETQYSAILLKRVNSSATVYVLTERNEVELNKITKESPVNDIFVIRKDESSRINKDVVMDFVLQIQKDLKTIATEETSKVPGRLINF